MLITKNNAEELAKDLQVVQSAISEFKKLSIDKQEEFKDEYLTLLNNEDNILYTLDAIFQQRASEVSDLFDSFSSVNEEDIEYALRYAKDKYGFEVLVCDADFIEECCDLEEKENE